jgi:hypothetical protein
MKENERRTVLQDDEVVHILLLWYFILYAHYLLVARCLGRRRP